MDGNKGSGALGLLSGGLDSRLAVRVLQRQGITVRAVVFSNPFFDITAARQAAESLGIPLRVYDFANDLIGLLSAPPHGFGKGMNPCIDCHGQMLRRAGELLAEENCRFLFTGEVLNQRPMSQTLRSLRTVAEDSTYADLVLRPLSAKLLPPTRPEREGWVNREQLLALHGRRRTDQFTLAAAYGIGDYPSPAGGCLLTEPHFCRRLKELEAHEGLHDRRAIERLRFGRHFRLDTGTKFILGRDAADNERIHAQVAADDLELALDDRNGPTGLLPAAAEASLHEACTILAFYGRALPGDPVTVRVRQAGAQDRIVRCQAACQDRIEAGRIG